ncbi:MAG: hypothetical protein JSV84_09725 [Gemmatimonadota bacterium]|nr:MAG: hypothetical protein JSV84_09725 [Gemmatimonadota bacterium]
MYKKFALIGLVIALVAGIALAKAVKVDLVPYVDADGNVLEPNAYGKAMLNYAKGADKTEVQVNCWDLVPNAMYTVYLNNSGTWYSICTFTTDSNGEGHCHAKLAGDVSGHLPVSVNNSANQTVLISP